MQGFIILFSGAMAYVLAPPLSRLIHAIGVREGRQG